MIVLAPAHERVVAANRAGVPAGGGGGELLEGSRWRRRDADAPALEGVVSANSATEGRSAAHHLERACRGVRLAAPVLAPAHDGVIGAHRTRVIPTHTDHLVGARRW